MRDAMYSTLTRSLFTRVGLFLCLLFLAEAAYSQIEQIGRYETVVSNTFDDLEVIPNGRNGLIILQELDQRSPKGTLWRVTKVDTTLREIWAKIMVVENSLRISKTDTLNGAAYVLYNNSSYSRSTLILKIHEDGTFTAFPFQNLVPMQITDFKVFDNGTKLLMGGYFNYRPIAAVYDISTNRPKILPGLFNDPGTILQLTCNLDTETINLVVNSAGRTTRGVWIKSYNFEGEILKNVFIENSDRKSYLVNARVVQLDAENHLLVGTYGLRNSAYSRGLVVGTLNESEFIKAATINFADLPNFFDFMKEGRKARVATRIERKKEKGRTPRFNYKIIVQDIRNLGDEFAMICEAHYVKYNSNTSRATNNYLAFDGYIYTHAFLLGFDADGTVNWGQSIRTTDIKKFELSQLVHFSTAKSNGILMYPSKSVIKYTSFEKELEGAHQDNEVEIGLQYPGDILRTRETYPTDIKHWYKNYYYVHGKQSIKNLYDQDVPLNRRVYFVNKIQFSETQDAK